jgi:type III pantothenate kinase
MPQPPDLVLDVGNTRTKAALFAGGRVLRWGYFRNGAPDLLDEWLSGIVPGRTACGAVGPGEEALLAHLKGLGRVVQLTVAQGVPLESRYRSMDTLGMDRAANAAAAAQTFPGRPVLAVDVGTCITYDLVDADSVYLGGAIAPGLHMRARAMHAYSARLPLAGMDGDAPLLGEDTLGSLQAGVLHGTRCEVAGMVRAYGKFLPGITVVFTGGDARHIAKALECGIFADPLLTLKGLHAILLHQDPAGPGPGPRPVLGGRGPGE